VLSFKEHELKKLTYFLNERPNALLEIRQMRFGSKIFANNSSDARLLLIYSAAHFFATVILGAKN